MADAADVREADNFYPVSLDPELIDILNKHKGVTLSGVVEIIALKNERTISEINNYTVTLENKLDFPQVNPNQEDLRELPLATSVHVAGKLQKTEDYDIIDKDNPKRILAHGSKLTIQTDEGTTIEVISYIGKTTFKDGEIENVTGKEPELGELVRIVAYVQEDHEEERRLYSRYNQPFLVEPSPERMSEYTKLRTVVSEEIEKLYNLLKQGDNTDYKEARRVFSELRSRELTTYESQKIEFILLFFPPKEKPIKAESRHLKGFNQINSRYDVLLETMTMGELIEFTKKVLKDIRQENEIIFKDYLYELLKENNIDDATFLSLLNIAIDANIEYLESQKGENGEDITFDGITVMRTLQQLSRIDNPEATKKIIEFIRFLMQNKYYDKRQEPFNDYKCPSILLTKLYDATDALYYSLKKNLKNISAIEDLDELLAWKSELQPFPYNETAHDYLERVINFFKFPEDLKP